MSTEQEASESNGQQQSNEQPQGQPANRDQSGGPSQSRWSRFTPRTPSNPVARPSSERGERRGDGHGGGHGGRRPQRQKHHQRGGGGGMPRGGGMGKGNGAGRAQGQIRQAKAQQQSAFFQRPKLGRQSRSEQKGQGQGQNPQQGCGGQRQQEQPQTNGAGELQSGGLALVQKAARYLRPVEHAKGTFSQQPAKKIGDAKGHKKGISSRAEQIGQQHVADKAEHAGSQNARRQSGGAVRALRHGKWP